MKTSIAKKLIFLFSFLVIIGCRTKLNQTINHQKEGLWIEYDTLQYVYKTVGKYHKNEQTGTWKYYYNSKLVRKEKYNKSICKTKLYYPNGKLEKKGYTQLDAKNDTLHWFYFGEWKFYNTNRKLVKSTIYTKGKTADSLNANHCEFKINLTNTK